MPRRPLLALNGSAVGLRQLPKIITKRTLPMAGEFNEFTGEFGFLCRTLRAKGPVGLFSYQSDHMRVISGSLMYSSMKAR